MSRYLQRTVLLIPLLLLYVFKLNAQNVEHRVTLTNVNFTNSTSSCATTSGTGNSSNLKVQFGTASGQLGDFGANCNAGTAVTGNYTLSNSYGTAYTIYLGATDSRAVKLDQVTWGAATGSTTSFNSNAKVPATSNNYTSTKVNNTTTANASWSWQWRYTSAPATASTISTSAPTSYCSINSPSGILLTGPSLSYQGIRYLWQQRAPEGSWGAAVGTNTNATYTTLGITSTTEFRRLDRYRNTYSDGAETYIDQASANVITITVEVPPTATGITGNTTLCAGTPMNISLSGYNTGSISPTIQWSTNAGFTNIIQSSSSPTLTATAPTGISTETIFVRAVFSGACSSPVTFPAFDVYYIQPSTAPTSITSTADVICAGESVTLTMNGAVLGDGAEYQWSTSSNFSSILKSSPTDNTLTVSPDSTKIYYARVGNNASPCPATTSVVSKSITVNHPSIIPDSIASTSNFYCQGSLDPIRLSVAGGRLGTGAEWQWSDDPGFSNILATDAEFIDVLPSATTTYYVRAINTASPCDATTAAVSKEIQYKTQSFAADSISRSVPGLCQGSTVTLTVEGGSLGVGGEWVWYANSCGASAPIATGSSITVVPTVDTEYFVRAEGDCDTTTCVSTFIRVFQPSVNPTGITKPASLCMDDTYDIVLSVEGGFAGSGLDWQWYDENDQNIGTGSSITIDLLTYRDFYSGVYVKAENTGVYGPIPAPCVEETDTAYTTVTDILIDVYPIIDEATIDNDLFCDDAEFTITLAGNLLDAYDGIYETGVFNIYDVNPVINLSATPIASNNTGEFNLTTDSTQTYYGAIVNTCGISNVESFTVTVNYSSVDPTAFNLSADTVCSDNSTVTITLTDGSLGTDATWALYNGDPENGGTLEEANNTSGEFEVSPSETTTYYVRYEGNAAPCTEVGVALPIEIIVVEPSVAPTAITSTADSICNGDATLVTLTSDGTLGTDAIYEWSADAFATVIAGENTNTIEVSPTATTTYSVRISNTTAPCTDVVGTTASFLLTVTEPSVAPTAITPSVSTICNGDATLVTLTADGTLGTDAVYEWSDDAFATVIAGENTNTLEVSPTVTTTYSVRISGPAPCSDVSASVATTVITVNEPSIAPTAITSTADSICNGDATLVTLTADGTLGTDAIYEWSEDAFATVIAGENTNTLEVSPTATTTYSVRIANTATPCTDVSATEVDFTITVTEGSVAPTAITPSVSTICNGDATLVTLTADGTLGTDAVYEWSDDAFATVIAGENTNTLEVSPTVTTTYSVRISGPAPCSDVSASVATTVITVNEPSIAPTAITATADSICNGDATLVTLTADGTLGTDAIYEWSDDAFATVIAGENTNTLEVSPTATTTYSVRIANTATPCTDVVATEVDFTITVTEGSVAPTAITPSVSTICNGDATLVTLIADGTLGTDAIYEWSEDAFATVIAGENTNTIEVSPTATTTYSVRIAGPAPCSDISASVATTVITVNEPSIAPTAITSTADSICNGANTLVTLTADGTLGTDAIYEWSEDAFATVIAGENTNTLEVSPTATTTYSVRIANTATPCTDVVATEVDFTITVTEGSVAPTAITPSVSTICNGDATLVTLTADGTLGTDAVYEWSDDAFATVIAGENTNTIEVSPTATTTYSVRIAGPAPCSDISASVATTVITVNEPSIAPTAITATADSICNGANTLVTLTADGTLGTDAIYEWSDDAFATVIAGENTNTLEVSPTATTTYSVRIANTATPCTDVVATEVDFTITVTEGSVAPTAITPSVSTICNGDATLVTLTADGTLGTDAIYEWSEDAFATVIAGENTNTLEVSPTVTTTYSVRIAGPAPCSDVSASVATTEIVVNEPSVAPTSITLSADSICNTSNTSITITADGTLGTGAAYEWSTDNFNSTIAGESGNTITVQPTTTTTYSVRIVGPTPCTDVSATVVSKVVTITAPANAPTSVTISEQVPCIDAEVTLTQVGGVLPNGVSYFEWATDAAFANVIDTTSSNTIEVVVTEPTTYYVRIVDPLCGNSAAASASIDVVQSYVSPIGDGLATSSYTISSCVIDDSDWHYFVDANGDVVAAINSNGQDLGQVEWTVTLGNNGPFVNPSNTLCPAGEFHAARVYNFRTENQATSDISVRIFITPAEYAAHKLISDAQNAQYSGCYGTTSTASDLNVSAFFEYDNGAQGLGITPSYSVIPGLGGAHQYQFNITPSYPSGGRTGGRTNPLHGVDLYVHNSGGRSSILPVELTSFTATVVEEGVLLNWATASEKNNDRFEVLRSEDGVNFEVVGYVSGMGTTTTPHTYSFLDTDVATGVYYYQLRQVDFDGQSELSKIVSVEILGETTFNVGLFYPNPAQRTSSVNVTTPVNSKVVFTLYSIDGKQAMSRVYPIARGDNRIDIDLNNIPAGSYIGIFQTEGKVINRKLIIQD